MANFRVPALLVVALVFALLEVGVGLGASQPLIQVVGSNVASSDARFF